MKQFLSQKSPFFTNVFPVIILRLVKKITTNICQPKNTKIAKMKQNETQKSPKNTTTNSVINMCGCGIAFNGKTGLWRHTRKNAETN